MKFIYDFFGWCWHDWSKLGPIKQYNEYVYDIIGPILITEAYQERACNKCGKIERVKVKL